MFHIRRKQSGLTFISILVILFVIGFFAMLVLKILPIYLDNFKVRDSLASLSRDGAMENYSKAKILDTIGKRLNANNIDDLIRPEDIQVVKTPNYVSITIQYEVVQNIYGNLSVLVEFNEKYEAGKR